MLFAKYLENMAKTKRWADTSLSSPVTKSTSNLLPLVYASAMRLSHVFVALRCLNLIVTNLLRSIVGWFLLTLGDWTKFRWKTFKCTATHSSKNGKESPKSKQIGFTKTLNRNNCDFDKQRCFFNTNLLRTFYSPDELELNVSWTQFETFRTSNCDFENDTHQHTRNAACDTYILVQHRRKYRLRKQHTKQKQLVEYETKRTVEVSWIRWMHWF